MHPRDEVLQTPKCNDNAFRLASATAGKQNVKWVAALHARGRNKRGRAGKFCDVFRREKQRRTRDCQNFVDALLREYCVQRNIGPAGFYRSEKRDEGAGGIALQDHLIAAQPEQFDWPQLDENSAASLSYTSGTTGNPKGVVYAHRSWLLHALAACTADGFSLSAADSALVVVPMFHVNGWGMAYAGALRGAKLVLPGPATDGASLYQLMRDESVTLALGVPTVWMMLQQHVESGACQAARAQRLGKCGLIDQPTARGVEQNRSGLHGAPFRRANHSARGLGQGTVERQYVGLGQQLAQRHAPGIARRMSGARRD